MKPVFFLVLLFMESYGEPMLEESFEKGVGSVPELYLEDFLVEPALQLKRSIMQAFSEFNRQVDQSLSRNASLAIRTIDQRLKNYNNLLEHHLPDVVAGSATPTTFDQFLQYMDEMYNVFLNLDLTIHGSARSGKTGQQSSLQSMNEIFLNLERNVKLFLDKLQQWTTDIVSAGLMREVEDLPTVQDIYRKKYLYPEVQVVQRYAKQLEQYEDIFQNFSTPDVWKEYKATRDKVIQIEV